ncbi:hypothetical protein OP10G_2455 [Fimbriimonas ginsengisoli Gsoil 348]|uniref:Uncharacterized protein n=2 Tax=Fimbriimonas ginsengisoli TaxID=1005039 RepID=A0A068NQH9_FIMGI|nr:hypothetical protein OP10G_2455 [Fimbriimonas ginsengisoli Gsoil 348]
MEKGRFAGKSIDTLPGDYLTYIAQFKGGRNLDAHFARMELERRAEAWRLELERTKSLADEHTEAKPSETTWMQHVVIMQPVLDLNRFDEIQVTLKDNYAELPDGRRIPKSKFIPIGRVKMPFGQHKGKRIEEVGEPYLRWMVKEMIKRGGIVRTVERYLEDLKAARNA